MENKNSQQENEQKEVKIEENKSDLIKSVESKNEEKINFVHPTISILPIKSDTENKQNSIENSDPNKNADFQKSTSSDISKTQEMQSKFAISY